MSNSKLILVGFIDPEHVNAIATYNTVTEVHVQPCFVKEHGDLGGLDLLRKDFVVVNTANPTMTTDTIKSVSEYLKHRGMLYMGLFSPLRGVAVGTMVVTELG